jgi:diamine N-acetyltransferase
MHLIRKATIEDIPSIRALAQTTFYHTYESILTTDQMDFMFDWMYSNESLHKQMQELQHTFYLYLSNKQLLGFASIEQQDDQLFHLHKLYINPDTQQKGAGRTLIQTIFSHAKEHAKNRPCIVELNVNRHNKALKFYEKMGMHIHTQGDFEIGNGYFMNDYILRIEL